MSIPDEDQGPAWLGDHGRIEADIAAMSQFARSLTAEIQDNYVPHAGLVIADMETGHPQPVDAFAEHSRFLRDHEAAIRAATDNVYWYIQAGISLGDAATEISNRYADADAFSAAQTRDVLDALDATGRRTEL